MTNSKAERKTQPNTEKNNKITHKIKKKRVRPICHTHTQPSRTVSSSDRPDAGEQVTLILTLTLIAIP